MQCPYCNAEETKVTDKRDAGSVTRRRRECLKCGKRFTTYERVELDLYIVKKDGRRERFSRNKLLHGVEKCLQKRHLDDEHIEEIIDDIEARVYRMAKDKDIKSSKIGEIVMNKLRKVDKVAYIRFAAVYKDFDDIDKFKEEIEKIE